MAGAHPHIATPSLRPDTAREDAFTLIELMIVLIITMVLVTTAFWLTKSTRTTSSRTSAVAAARTMGDAIDDFRKDHGGRAPALGDAQDWPAPTADGPRNGMNGRAYLRNGAPDGLDGKMAQLTTPGATAGARYALEYATYPGRPGGWSITIRDTKKVAPTCTIRGGVTPTLEAAAC